MTSFEQSPESVSQTLYVNDPVWVPSLSVAFPSSVVFPTLVAISSYSYPTTVRRAPFQLHIVVGSLPFTRACSVMVVPAEPTAARISTRPHPKTLFGGPAVPHWVEEIKWAALSKVSRLASIWFFQLGMGRPEQRHGASDMRSCHGGAIGKRIGSIGKVTGRARAGARSSDIRFYPPASIDGDRTAAAKGSSGIGAGVERPDRVRCLIERWWICQRGTTRSGVTRCNHHHDASSGLSFNRGLQCVDRATFRSRADPTS